MRQKKFAGVFSLCLALALLAGGCKGSPGDSQSPNPSAGSDSGPVEVTPTPPPPFASRGMRIALCTSPDSVSDQGRNAQCYDGVLSFALGREGRDSVTPLQEVTGDPEQALQSFGPLVPSYDVMVFVGDAFTHLAPLARDYPNVYFILVDAPLTEADGTPAQVDNVYAMTFAEEECGFLAGMAAALETQTGRIAVLTDVPSDASTRYYYGFRSGVAFTNGNYGLNAQVVDHPAYSGVAEDGTALGGNYTGGSDTAAYHLANSLMDEGCDILFVAAGTSGDGALDAVKARPEARIIGAETDQYLKGETGSENVVLTSVFKDYSSCVGRQLSAIADDVFHSGSYTLHAADSALSYASADDRQQLQSETRKALADAYPLMQNGTIVPMAGPAE